MKRSAATPQPNLTVNPIRNVLMLLVLLLGLAGMQTARGQSFALSNLWSMAASTNIFLNPSDSATRGLACNPVTGHLLVPSRSVGSNAVHVLDGTTGVEVGILPFDTNVIKGGTFVINMVGVTDDGVI